MTTNPRTHLKTWTRRVLGTTLTLILTAATLAGVVLAGVVVTSRSIHQPVPTDSADVPASSLSTLSPAARRTSPARGMAGGSSSRSSRAPTAPSPATSSRPTTSSPARRRSPPTSSPTPPSPAPLEGGPAVVPTHTFADVDADPALTPDLVVVPGLTKPTGTAEAPLRSWVARQHDDGAQGPRRVQRRTRPRRHRDARRAATPPATGPASARSRRAAPPCTGCAAVATSRTGP